MALIIHDETTGGKFKVKAIDDYGEDVEVMCDHRVQAQLIANNETSNMLTYFEEFRTIDGLSQHPTGLNFRQWLKSKIK